MGADFILVLDQNLDRLTENLDVHSGLDATSYVCKYMADEQWVDP